MEQDDRYHYKVMQRAIAAIDDDPAQQLTLEDLAARIGMSAPHFQRVFSRWVGVSPKRYQQYLTLDHARSLLQNNFTTLATADAVGLSGGGRLHDLFLRWEAMTPGDYALQGSGLVISYGWFDSPFGPALVMGTDKGICGIGFASETGEAAAMACDDPINKWWFLYAAAMWGPLADLQSAPALLQRSCAGLHPRQSVLVFPVRRRRCLDQPAPVTRPERIPGSRTGRVHHTD